MKQKLRLAAICLTLHLVVSGVIWGGLCVYQRGYNTMHREQLAVASVTVTQERAELQVLQGRCALPVQWFSEDSPLYYAAYVLAGEPLQFWLYLADLIPYK